MRPQGAIHVVFPPTVIVVQEPAIGRVSHSPPEVTARSFNHTLRAGSIERIETEAGGSPAAGYVDCASQDNRRLQWRLNCLSWYYGTSNTHQVLTRLTG